MSMVINLVEDHNIYLCEGGPVYNGGVQPTPITYLTQWQIVGNSEVHGSEIWSCGEYNPIDGKYHILVQPQGGSIADIALDEPLRKVNDVADTIEFSNSTAVVTRNIASTKWNNLNIRYEILSATQYARFYVVSLKDVLHIPNDVTERIKSCLSSDFTQNTEPINRREAVDKCMCTYKVNGTTVNIYIRDTSTTSEEQFYEKYGTHEFLYRLKTPTTEIIQAPQIEEADSYSCVISPDGKAVSWSEFLDTLNYLLTDSENNILVDSKNYQLTVQS